jgi:hypothetical protein
MNWTPTQSESVSQHSLSFSLAELPSQIVMSVPESGKNPLRRCRCGCNRLVTRWTRRRHLKNNSQLESPPPPKRRRIAHSQAGQESPTDNNSSTSHSRADASTSSSDHPQLHAPSFEFNPSLPSPPEDARTEVSGLFVDDVLLNLYARTHRTTDQSDDEDSEDALEGDTVEAADYGDHETDGLWNGEDVAVENDVDPREGVVSDWDLLAEKSIVEMEELGKFGHSLLHTP